MDEYTHLRDELIGKARKEVAMYRKVDQIDSLRDPLVWWATFEKEYPAIADVAARYLCCSASSASSERLFSSAGLTMTKKRMRMTGDSIAAVLTVRGAIVAGLLDEYLKNTNAKTNAKKP